MTLFEISAVSYLLIAAFGFGAYRALHWRLDREEFEMLISNWWDI